jgi:hypothetical protein
MIAPGCFTSGWIRDHAEELRARDMKTLEKCMLALELVARLRQAGLEFIFKGGTSLALLFDPPRRLSIDVDILCLEPIGKLREALDQATFGRMPFVRWEHQEHRDREAPPTRLFSEPFQRAESRLAAGRAALAAELIRARRADFNLPAFLNAGPDLQSLGPASLDAPWQNLNRLKQTDPSAFACWFAAQEIRRGADSPTGPIPAKTSHA